MKIRVLIICFLLAFRILGSSASEFDINKINLVNSDLIDEFDEHILYLYNRTDNFYHDIYVQVNITDAVGVMFYLGWTDVDSIDYILLNTNKTSFEIRDNFEDCWFWVTIDDEYNGSKPRGLNASYYYIDYGSTGEELHGFIPFPIKSFVISFVALVFFTTLNRRDYR